ncbi:fibroblast growth factor receptor substrate 2-like [Aplochiton taeniatus]
MGSSCSCSDNLNIPDNQLQRFKVINVDDDGHELGSGVMELEEEGLVLHTHRHHDIIWPYACLRRYGYDSNLFSFESGRRCQTGHGIFAFKCLRAEELFNQLQDIMFSHSFNIVESGLEITLHSTHTPRTAPPGYSGPPVASTDGLSERCGSNSRSTVEREPQVVLEPMGVKFVLGPTPAQKLLQAQERREEAATEEERDAAVVLRLEDQKDQAEGTVEGSGAKSIGAEDGDGDACSRAVVDEMDCSGPIGEKGTGTTIGTGAQSRSTEAKSGSGSETGPVNVDDRGGGGLKETGVTGREGPHSCLSLISGDCDTGYHSDKDLPHLTLREPPQLNKGTSHNHILTAGLQLPALLDPAPSYNSSIASHNHNNSSHTSSNSSPRNLAQRHKALLNYENLPPLPTVRETQNHFSAGEEDEEEEEDEEVGGLKTTIVNGYHHHHPLHRRGAPPRLPPLDPFHNYINTENVVGPLSARLDSARLLSAKTPTVFNFDIRPPAMGSGELNYIEVEMEKDSDSNGQHTPTATLIPPLTAPLLPPQTPGRRSELYAVIDLRRTAAMSSLHRAQPQDDGTARRTRHNSSTRLPM